MVNYGEITKTTKSISKKAVEEVFKNDPVPAGTILMSFKLTIGKISKLKVNAFHNEAIISIFPPYKELKEYLFRILPILATGGDTNNAIKGKTLNKNSLNNLLIPLPPLEEQKHIVTKVDQLMELCDHLESLEQKKHESHIHLNNTALNKMLDASSPEEFEENWRLVCDNFGLLYDNIENVEKLRQSILQLAVMGKLVEQDADDEPAEVLLEKIYAEKERLVKEKKIKKSKVSSKIEENEIPYQIPNNWKWTRADVVSKAIEYGTSHKASTNGSNVPVLRMNNINKGKISYENLKYVPDEIKDLPRLFLKTNDLLFNRTNSYELVGKTGIFKGNDDEYTFASYLIRMSLLDDCVNPDFINNAMNAEYYRKTQIEPEITQQCGQANFNGTKLKHSLIPLPPLEEQKRIVTRVDQLMELCDRLEAGIRQVQEDGEKLMEVAVSGLLASCD
jgi:type I restriction enzyme S subunit